MRSTQPPIGSFAAWSALMTLTFSTTAVGQVAQGPASTGSKVAAEALFEDARTLVAAGKFAEACPKFADSERLDPSPSTLLNLANCFEKIGHTATAWATYKEAESAASAVKRQDYLATAQRHAEALSAKLARLTIAVQETAPGLQLTRDGSAVTAAEWGAPIPIDAGTHEVTAGAAGFKPWTGKVEVPEDGAQVTVTVPPLEALPVDASPPSPGPAHGVTAEAPAPAPVASAGGAQRTIGLLVGGAGVVGLGVSAALAFVASSKNKDSKQYCVPSNSTSCFPMGVTERDDALRAGDGATVAFGVGAAALVGGIVLWLTAPTEPTKRGSARLTAAPTIGGAMVEASW